MSKETKEEKEFLRQLKSRLRHINPYEYAKTVRKKFEDGLDEKVVSQAAMKLRTDPRFVARWMEYTGASTYEEIDWTNPCVYIEWIACDIRILNMCDDAKLFIEETGCDEETFMRYYWPEVPDAQFDNSDQRAKAYRHASNPVSIMRSFRRHRKDARNQKKS